MPKAPPDDDEELPDPTFATEARERLAVNLFDLDRMNPDVRAMLLGGKLDLAGGAIRVDDSRLDETGVTFSCDLLTAASICDVIRNQDRIVGDYPTRIYVFRRAWSRLPGDEVLTEVVVGKVRLRRRTFASLPVTSTFKASDPVDFSE